MGFALARLGQAGKQTQRVGMARSGEELGNRRFFHDFAGIEHDNALAELGHHAQIVRDIQHARAPPGYQFAQQVQNHRFGSHIQACGGLVQDEQIGVAHQRHGDGDSLLHAAAELVRIALCHLRWIDQVDIVECVQDTPVCLRAADAFCRLHRLAHLRADAHGRVERRAGILWHQLDVPRPQLPQARRVHRQHVLAQEAQVAAIDASVGAQIMHQSQRRRRFSAAALADNADDLPRVQLQVETAQSRQPAPLHAIADAQSAHIQQLRHIASPRPVGGNPSPSPSPSGRRG